MCNQRELESLIGILNHACKVVCPGQSFLRCMLNLLKCPHVRHTGRCPTRHISLNSGSGRTYCGGGSLLTSGTKWYLQCHLTHKDHAWSHPMLLAHGVELVPSLVPAEVG